MNESTTIKARLNKFCRQLARALFQSFCGVVLIGGLGFLVSVIFKVAEPVREMVERNPHQTIVRFMDESKEAGAAFRAELEIINSQDSERYKAAALAAFTNEQAYEQFKKLAIASKLLNCPALLTAAKTIKDSLETNGQVQTMESLVSEADMDECRAR
jgi:hypothetical protein